MVSTKPQKNNKQNNTETLTKAPNIFERNKFTHVEGCCWGGRGVMSSVKNGEKKFDFGCSPTLENLVVTQKYCTKQL